MQLKNLHSILTLIEMKKRIEDFFHFFRVDFVDQRFFLFRQADTSFVHFLFFLRRKYLFIQYEKKTFFLNMKMELTVMDDC